MSFLWVQSICIPIKLLPQELHKQPAVDNNRKTETMQASYLLQLSGSSCCSCGREILSYETLTIFTTVSIWILPNLWIWLMAVYILGEEKLESCPLKEIWRSLLTASWTWVNSVLLQPGRISVFRGAWSMALLAGQGKWLSALHCTDVASLWVLCAVLCNIKVRKGHKIIRDCPKEG